jgi:nucleotide-binding universal stress UspA family protein
VSSPVLCAVDLSDEGDEAIRQAHALSTLYGAPLIAFHAMPAMASSAPLFPTSAQADSTAFVALERRVLEALTARVATVTGRLPSGFTVELGWGTAPSEIVKAAERLHAGFVVVGGAGPKGVMRRLLGAVAERVVRHAHCPVWVAHTHAGAGPVVAATDFSPQAQAALDAAAQHAKRTGTTLSVTHALSIEHVEATGKEAWSVWTPDELARLRSEGKAHLDAVAAKAGVQLETVISDAAPGAAVLHLAEQRHARLICVGTVGRTGLSRVLLGSVAEEVVRKAHCPVLVWRD